jgi:hypothetical protein
LADTETTPRNLREVEAETVALLCCESLGLEGADYCRGYIQNWLYQGVGFDAGAIPEKSAQKIFRAVFSEWWQRIANAYNVRANLHLNGNEYGKYGTTFDVQLLVIDKTGQTPGDSWKEQLENIVWSDAVTIEDAWKALSDIADRLDATTDQNFDRETEEANQTLFALTRQQS